MNRRSLIGLLLCAAPITLRGQHKLETNECEPPCDGEGGNEIIIDYLTEWAKHDCQFCAGVEGYNPIPEHVPGHFHLDWFHEYKGGVYPWTLCTAGLIWDRINRLKKERIDAGS